MNATEPWLQPIVLEGAAAHLVPLSRDHCMPLQTAVADGALWKLWYTNVPTVEGMAAEIDRRLKLQEAGAMLPFTVIETATGEPVGMSTYMNVDAVARRVEIGSTWYRRRVQRSAVNTTCKLLLLGHAFETLDCIAVELRTSFMNRQSRRAIEGLGAKLDGVLRQHSRHRDGSIRDTCVYSILPGEWPAVKAHLTGRLERYGP
jgi:RimJ/RimL family protein N-acetyltransferase